ncbi:MAG: sigma-70 family RNA polymerase sigma factor [Chloroflexi bacterium]|nr:sigma-70 family RNA polymerase sigma factor [Chloroflexota bacterium]
MEQPGSFSQLCLMMVIAMMVNVDFEALVDAHSRELYAYLWRMLGNAAEAQDCLQESYFKAYRAYGRLDETANTRAWLYKIATNTGLTWLKKRGLMDRRSVDFVEGLASHGAGVEAQVEIRVRLAEVHAAVQRLPDKQRAALMLRKYHEMDYAEIGAALSCSPESARANVYQGLKKLRDQLVDEVAG